MERPAQMPRLNNARPGVARGRRRAPLLALAVMVLCSLWAAAAAARGSFTLAADPVLVESGILRHLSVRFTLKTAIRIEPVAPDAPADARLTAAPREAGAVAVLVRGPRVWFLEIGPGEGPRAEAARRFRDWLRSKGGRAAIAAFRPADGGAPFAPAPEAAAAPQPRLPGGRAARGARLAYARCGRCHVVGEGNRMAGIGSTPSFMALRALPDWRERFETFYVRNPHPAFVEVIEVHKSFSEARPAPISPLALDLDDLADILAYVEALPPADLGAPVQMR